MFMLAWVLGGAFVLKRLMLSRIDSKVPLLIQLPEGEKGVYFVQFTLKREVHVCLARCSGCELACVSALWALLPALQGEIVR